MQKSIESTSLPLVIFLVCGAIYETQSQSKTGEHYQFFHYMAQSQYIRKIIMKKVKVYEIRTVINTLKIHFPTGNHHKCIICCLLALQIGIQLYAAM